VRRIKLFVIFLTLFFGCFYFAGDVRATNVLFIGNSFTHYIDDTSSVPDMFQKIAQTAGKNVVIGSYIVGQQDLKGFWNDPNETALSKIRNGPGGGGIWDYVVLEPWDHDEANSPAQDMYDYGRLFVDEIVRANPQAKTLIYMVHWNSALSYLNSETMQTMNSEQTIYESVVNTKPSAILVPVEWAWIKGIYEYPEQSWFNTTDNWHPGPRRTYIAAVSMYATIYHTLPACSSDAACSAASGLDP
jgi:hypothetical protein